jgi:hypothetical protein
MMRPICIGACASFAGVMMVNTPAVAQQQKKPNVVVLMTDGTSAINPMPTRLSTASTR